MDKKKQGITFTEIKILIFMGIGIVIGLVVGLFYFNWLFGEYMLTIRKYIDNDWAKVQYYSNRIVDQAIVLNNMMHKDKVQYDSSVIDELVDTRARLIGSDKLEDKFRILSELEKKINTLVEYYNSRMDLKNMRFGYIEWGIITGPYIDEYNEHKTRYAESVELYNSKIKKFPFKGAARKKQLTELPFIKVETIVPVNYNREEYKKDNVFKINKLEGSSSAGGN